MAESGMARSPAVRGRHVSSPVWVDTVPAAQAAVTSSGTTAGLGGKLHREPFSFEVSTWCCWEPVVSMW